MFFKSFGFYVHVSIYKVETKGYSSQPQNEKPKYEILKTDLL